MNLWRARISLLSVFVCSWIANGLILLSAKKTMDGSQNEQIFTLLATMHSVPIGILAGGIFADINPRKKSIPAGVAWTALLLSVLWVALVCECWVGYPSSIKAPELIDELGRRSSEVSFLIAGALAYFSTKAK